MDFHLDAAPVRFDDLDVAQLGVLRCLTNGPADYRDTGYADGGSAFRSRIDTRLRYGDRCPGSWVIRAWMDPQQPSTVPSVCVGWTLFDVDRQGKRIEAGFYVEPTHRRCGIGRQLLQRVRYLGKHIFHCDHLVTQPWNAISRRFFDSQAPTIASDPGYREFRL